MNPLPPKYNKKDGAAASETEAQRASVMSAYPEHGKSLPAQRPVKNEVASRSLRLADQELVAKIVAGDKEAFAQIVDRFSVRIYRLAYRMCGSTMDAEDLTQEIFLAIYRSLQSFRGDSSLSTWVYRIAMNHCVDFQRRHRPQTLSLDEQLIVVTDRWCDNPQEALHKEELGRQIEEALSHLAPHHREVVILHELHGLTYTEVAKVLQIPVGTVKSRLSNAFRQLRELLRDYVEDEEDEVP
ncbi:RNA polymerase sigma factor [Chthonomonas calidirosea]|uniref:RNA polymerase sigma factor n=1 Tax=Chthonomonas calidirosea TaxID=454171 RepID=UPI0006ECA4AB|nr:RNA polymerase sigma factor [Chthonomonas calidirosea]CEK13976.1 RNA polymerase sigma factor, sigma-70 family [Chthonomonas calidirosea]